MFNVENLKGFIMRKPNRLPNHEILQRKANESVLTYIYLVVVVLHNRLEVETNILFQ